MKKQHVQLTQSDRDYLTELTGKGSLAVRVYKRALALLELDRGKTYVAVAVIVGVNHNTVSKWAKSYAQEGLALLQDKPRCGRPVEFDGVQRAKITALACSEPPEGCGVWTLRLLADQAVELGYCDRISHTQVSDILKKTISNPT